MADKVYLAIDLKSFYASVECVERGLDPLTTNLVVADLSRTERPICLAVTPALKLRHFRPGAAFRGHGEGKAGERGAAAESTRPHICWLIHQ